MKKIYPKRYEDLFQENPHHDSWSRKLSSVTGSIDELAILFRDFLRESNNQLFDIIVRQVWLEMQVSFNGERRMTRFGNNIGKDWAFAKFMKAHVGISQKSITGIPVFTSTSTYLKDFFPGFLNSNPFDRPEDYVFPYKHLTLDHLAFVYKVHNRLDLLEYAEDKYMKYHDFVNWAVNQVLCYNDEVGAERYVVSLTEARAPYINDVTLKRGWSKDFLKFYEEPKKRGEGPANP